MPQSEYTKKLMENLEKIRIESNMSQSDFAAMLKTSRSHYAKMLSGDVNKISADAVKNIYDATGYLCFELMEVYSDDFLQLIKLLHQFTSEEIIFMKQFVEVYLESKRRFEQ